MKASLSVAVGICAAISAAQASAVDRKRSTTRVVAPLKPNTSKKPNIVLFLTDDQDVSTLHREYLPKIWESLVDPGTLFDNFFAPVSVCCPSRVSLFRTQLAHNHNVTFVTPPWGGWVRFNELGYHKHTLPDFLQDAGYNTYYTGKFMNHHTVDNCESLPVSGWNGSDFLVDPHTYDYWTPAFSRDNGPAKVHKGEYSTDLVAKKALDYLDEALDETRPFFLGIAPVACHSWISHLPDKADPLHDLESDIPAAHPRHQRLFTKVQAPRKESWNPEYPTGVSWVKELPRLNSTVEAYLDEFYRGRLRALQPVDELVEAVVKKLEKSGQLDNTYIFYTADNGYAFGTHRRQPGKTLGFEEDIHVPLIARGPGIKNGHRETLSSYGMVDLSATILDIAGAAADFEIDGNVIAPVRPDSQALAPHVSKHSISEYWVLGVEEGAYGGGLRVNNTYRTVRIHDETSEGNVTFSYSVWCTGERELYDLDEDPSQVRNLLKPLNEEGAFLPFDARSSGKEILSSKIQKIVTRLDALVLVLKSCVGVTCQDPYRALFPNLSVTGGQIASIVQALDQNYDRYFANLPRVKFSECALGYQTRFEHPIWRADLGYGHSAPNPLIVQTI